MRLSDLEKKIIKSEAKKIFGKNTKVFIFGSRVDNNKKGGDIDIFIIPENKESITRKKLQYYANIQLKLGLQKIDIVIYDKGLKNIEKIALKTGIEL